MSIEDLQTWTQLLNDLPALARFLAVYVLLELVLDVGKRSPLWLLRQFFGTLRRFWGELRYLRALITYSELKQWEHRYVTLRAIKARLTDGAAESRPLLDILQEYVSQGQQAVVLGEPGAGKTTALEALTYRLARRAFWGQVAVWVVFFSLTALLTAFHSRWWGLLLLIIPLFDLVFCRWPLPLFIEPRRYEGGDMETFLKQTVAGRVGGQAVSDSLRGYVERRRLVWLLDGVNEVRGGAYESAVDSWREHFTPGHYFAHAPVIFTSRTGENPARRLGLKEVPEVLDLDDEGVRDFLRAYGSHDVEADFATLERNHMLGERGLGRNPYWLKMMVRSGLYTRNRGALFENFARRLLQREMDKSPVRPQPSAIPVDDEMEALGHLAHVMSDAGQVGLALNYAEATLAEWLEHRKVEWIPRQFLDEAEAATLMRISRRENWADFIHPLVQEFFTAYALRLRLDEALRRADDPRWWETLLVLGGLLEEHTIGVRENVGSYEDYCRFAQGVLDDGSNDRRLLLAVGLLHSMDEPDAELETQVTTALAKHLHHGVTPELKQAAIDLARIVGDELTETLGGLLREEDSVVKKGAVEILGELGSSKAAEVLVAWIGDEAVAEHAGRALVSIGKAAVEPLIRTLRGVDGGARWTAAEILGRIGKSAVEPLTGTLHHENWWVREVVVEALRKIGEPAVGPLIGVLEDGDWHVRQSAAEALGEIGDARAVKSLGMTLRDESWQVRMVVVEALVKIGEPAVQTLNTALRGNDGEVRRAVIEGLGRIGDVWVVEPLITALRDEYWLVRWGAVAGLAKIGGPAVEPLIAALWSEDSQVRWGAAEALEQIRDVRAVEPLIAFLQDEDSEVCQVLVRVLGKIGDARAVRPLIAALGDVNHHVRRAAAEALSEVGDVQAVEPLTATLRDEDGNVRKAAARALGKIGDKQGVEPLIGALQDEDGNVRRAAAEALEKIGDTRAVQPLIAVLQDKNSEVRQTAVWALGGIGDRRAVQPVIRLLRDEDSEVRQAAGDVLWMIGDGRTVELLIPLLRDEDSYVRTQVAWALGMIGVPAVEPLITALRNEDSRVRGATAEILGQIGDVRAVQPLIAVLEEEDSEVRREAVRALGRIGDPQATQRLIPALKDQEGQVRQVAAQALGKIGDTRGMKPLIAVLQDKNGEVRGAAVWALGKIGDARAVEPLIAVLQDKNSEVRGAAVWALWGIGDARAVEPLIAMLGDRDSDVSDAAAIVLRQIGAPAVEPLLAVLGDQESKARREAAELLGAIGDVRALPHLEQLVKGDDVDEPHMNVADAAWEAIKQIRRAQRREGGQADG